MSNINTSKELLEAIEKARQAQKQLKKRQQLYCINRYYKQKEIGKSNS